jgi:hypothetical protein
VCVGRPVAPRSEQCPSDDDDEHRAVVISLRNPGTGSKAAREALNTPVRLSIVLQADHVTNDRDGSRRGKGNEDPDASQCRPPSAWVCS